MELNKENFDAIIIGSGIGGLVTASIGGERSSSISS